MVDENWKASLKEFFSQRGAAISRSALNLEDLAFVSGRDPRVWTNEVYQDLIQNIVNTISASSKSSILEVGCASGFLAYGLSERVSSYEGIDLAENALIIARKLGLKNSSFTLGDGAALPYKSASFDATLCYDVFTNFPNFQVGEELIAEMLRVTRPGGYVLVGSIPDVSQQENYIKKVAEVSKSLYEKYGPLNQNYADSKISSLNHGWWSKFKYFFKSPNHAVDASIYCYYFKREDFELLGKRMGCDSEFLELHSLNPYRGFRFNVLYKK